jgi:hypothetical protein
MKLIEQLRAKLALMGATLDFHADNNQFYLDAPSGYVWRSTGTRSLTVQWANNGGQTWLAEALRKDADRWQAGLEKVTDPQEIAAHRWDEGDDSWGAPEDAPAFIAWPSSP